MLSYINYPSWLKPEILSFLNLPEGNFLNFFRWYGLMYIIGFIISYIQSLQILKKDNLQSLNKTIIEEYYFWAIIGLIFGGRIFSCLVYNFDYYSKYPLEIIIPFQNWRFVGYAGMSFHGATIGVFLVSIFFTHKHVPLAINSTHFKNVILERIKNFNDKKIILNCYKENKNKDIYYLEEGYKKRKLFDFINSNNNLSKNKKKISKIFKSINYKINFRELCDLVFPIIPLGYTFGRVANFINSELWGRITASSIGILFNNANKVPLNLNKTKEVVNQLGWKINDITQKVFDSNGNEIKDVLGNVFDQNGNLTEIIGINLPRHPSQLYEAFFEGIILFLILWFPARTYKPFKGFLASVYLIFYSVFRIILEYFREPDLQFANFEKNKFYGFISGNLTMGQLLSWLMITCGLGLGIYFYYLSKKDNLNELN